MDRNQRRDIAHEKRESWELPHALVIEMDGALIDSIPILYNAYDSFLKKQGFVGSRTEFNKLVGLQLHEFLYQLSEAHSLRKSQENLLKSYMDFLLVYRTKISMLPDAESALTKASQLGLAMALVTSLPKNQVLPICKEHNLEKIFEVIITPQYDEVLPTEGSNPYYQALVELGTDPADTIAIVYSNQAKEDALEAGMTVWRLSSHSKDKLKIEPQTCINVTNWHNIWEFLNKRY